MRFFKIVKDGYIYCVGVGEGGEEITKEEFDLINSALGNQPISDNDSVYRLKTDLTWGKIHFAENEREIYVEEV